MYIRDTGTAFLLFYPEFKVYFQNQHAKAKTMYVTLLKDADWSFFQPIPHLHNVRFLWGLIGCLTHVCHLFFELTKEQCNLCMAQSQIAYLGFYFTLETMNYDITLTFGFDLYIVLTRFRKKVNIQNCK